MSCRRLVGAGLGVLALACGASTSSQNPVCHEEVTEVAWFEHHWGTVPINALWVGGEDGTTRVLSAREDGSIAGRDFPGRFAEVPVTTAPLVGIWGAETQDQLTVMTREGATYLSTLGAGVWDDGAQIPTSFAMRALTGSESGELWAVGAGGYLAHFDGAEWAGDRYDVGNLEGVWASGDSVWVVGDKGVSRRSNEGAAEGSGLLAAGLHAVFGLPTGEVFVVGDGGAWLVWDGATWNQITTPTQSALRAVWADAELGAWAGGDDGTLLHLAPDAAEASAEEPPSPDFALHVTAIFGARVPGSSSDPFALWAGTAEGSVLSKEAVISTVCE